MEKVSGLRCEDGPIRRRTSSGNLLSFLPKTLEREFSSEEPTFFEGAIEKLDGKEWKEYWFVLKPERLVYYVNNSMLTQTLLLKHVHQVKRSTERHGTTNLLLCSKDDAVLMILRAPHKEETNKWLFGLQRCLVYTNNQHKKEQLYNRPRRATVDMWSYPEMIPTHSMIKSFSENNLPNLQNTNLRVSVSCEQGRRRSNEDRHITIENLNEKFDLDALPPQAFFGVYDGHCGTEAVDFVCHNILGYFVNHKLFESNPEKAFVEAHEKLDVNFLKKAKSHNWRSGTTAISVLLRGNKIYVANLGDSRAVLCRKEKAVALSSDHKPNRDDEARRVTQANGWIESTEVLNIPRLYRMHLEDEDIEEEMESLIGWVTVHKVNGCLGMTRAIGDILIKDWRAEQFPERVFTGDLVIATPEVHMETIDRMNDRFMIIASDGLWDVFSNQEAVDFVRTSLLRKKSLDSITERLVEMAIELGSLDNITVVILALQ